MSSGKAGGRPYRVTRRAALKTLAASAGWTVVPSTVLGGRGRTPPSDRLTVACIGVGSQGLRVMMSFLEQSDVQVVTDPVADRSAARCTTNDGCASTCASSCASRG